MKQNKKIIAITGSIGTGKSSASNIIKSRGYKVIDADSIAHEILGDNAILDKIRTKFGKKFFHDGILNRSMLAEYVFENKFNLKILNSITHSAIFNRINELIKESDEHIIFIDIPLLIELKDMLEEYSFYPDEVWLVYSSKDIQIKRLMCRDNINRNYAIKKIESQISIEEKLKYSDVVINNNGNMEDLNREISRILENL